jgi:hypothetical protein
LPYPSMVFIPLRLMRVMALLVELAMAADEGK